MLCQSCEKKQATTHIKTILNGELKEYRLCSECAKKYGYATFLDDAGFDLDKLFGSFMEGIGQGALPSKKRCQCCGSSFEDIARTGKVGCAECYETFYEELLPSVRRIHGRTSHIGKLAHSAGTGVRIRSEIAKCRGELEQAIQAQEFEKAAKLRDRIRELEKSAEEHEQDGKRG